jgi:cytochrome c biogenesis protein CcdA/thiol-disulfide isomerase/thioredoxin
MQIDWINVGLAFLEGFALIVSPCILPVLPIILSASLTGNKARPVGIVAGFILAFTLFTLFSRALIQLASLDQNTIRNISFVILLMLGIIMVSKRLTSKFNLLTQGLSNIGNSLQSVNNSESGFWGGVFFGGLIGIIWTPCAGPILAVVIVQVVLQQTTVSSFIVLISFAIGVGVPMLLITILGRGIITQFKFFREKSEIFRQLLGYIIILTVVYLYFFPAAFLSYNRISSAIPSQANKLINDIEHPYQAPEIAGIQAWINSPPLTWNNLKGKVVLIDFWTYSCINCIRTLPYLKEWYAKYHDMGFEIIGVHSPEFQFEHDLNNVKQAVINFGIHYPVALDNQFVTWRNFKNEYWPAHYLVNKQGEVVYLHFGEGEYDVTENNIRFLLGVREGDAIEQTDEIYPLNITPETYLGYQRVDARHFSSPEGIINNIPINYSYPARLAQDSWALVGKWIIAPDKIISVSPNAAIKLHFQAKKIYMVMGAKKSVAVKLLLNGKPLADDSGADVLNSQMQVSQNRLYSVLNLKKDYEGELEIIAAAPGLEVYTFTFGS